VTSIVWACLLQKSFPEPPQQFLYPVCSQLPGRNDSFCELPAQPLLERLARKHLFPVGHLPWAFTQKEVRENPLEGVIVFDVFDKNKAGQQEEPVKVRRQAFLETPVKLQNISNTYRDFRLAQLLDE
jgi:hypothetical protein